MFPAIKPWPMTAPTLWMDGWQPPKLADVFWGGLRVCMAFKALLCSGDDELPQHRSVLRAIHTLNSPQNYTRLLGGLSPIHSMHRHGAQGLMWGARGPFLPVVAMVGCGCVGWCWPLEAYIRSTYYKNSKPGGTVGYPAQPGLTWRNRRSPSPTRINLEEP